VLIIDASSSALWAPFSDYFLFDSANPTVVTNPTNEIFSALRGMTCYPATVGPRLNNYQCRWNATLRSFVDAETGIALSFDFGTNYQEDLIVHHQAGGGADIAFSLLKQVFFETSLAAECRETLQRLGKDYDAIHIRNSDYKTDWRPFLKSLVVKIESPDVLICSDDHNVIRFCRDFFVNKRVLNTHMPPDTGGKGLHTHESILTPDERRDVVRNSFIDLVALASGRTLHFSNTTNGHPSGYSQLAHNLLRNRWVIDRILQM
jgi:hypothetical protein